MTSQYLPACVSLLIYEEICHSLHTRKRWFVVLPCMCVRSVVPCIRGSMCSQYSSYTKQLDAAMLMTSADMEYYHAGRCTFVVACIRGNVVTHYFVVSEEI
jgi:hypothetical protein